MFAPDGVSVPALTVTPPEVVPIVPLSTRAPLFVAQGAHDPRVKKAESDQIVAALKERGIDVLYMVKDNEGHGFHNEENRFDFYRAMEEFFGKYLGSKIEKRSEPAR